MNYQFQYPEAFWLLLLLPLFALLYYRYTQWRKRTVKRMGDQVLIETQTPEFSPFRRKIRFLLFILSFALGCIALANPRVPESSTEFRQGIDVVIAMDVSRSMLATDVAPDRLSRAKQLATRIIEELGEDRTSLVLFAGYGYIRTPLTFDKGSTTMFISVADPSTINQQGTNISDALSKSLLVFGNQEERFRTVVLITDGETHQEGAVETAINLAQRGIMINTVGIGSQQGATLYDSSGQVKEYEGKQVVSRLNENILKEIASVTNGVYIKLTNTDDAVESIMSQFSNIEKKALADTSNFTYRPFYSWFALPMLLLLIIELFFPDRKRRRII